MTDEEHFEAIDELATVFNEDGDAQILLDRIRFPGPRRPVFFPDPRAFWRRVYRDVQGGITAGGPEALLREALHLRAHNMFFRRFSVPDRDDVAEPRVSTSRLPATPPPVQETPMPEASSDLPPNPFGDQGRITDPGRFFGREDVLERIFQEIAAGRNVSLVGEAQIGQSSVLSMVLHYGPERLGRPREDFVYLNMETLSGDEDFFEALGEELGLPGIKGWKLRRALRDRRVIVCLDELEKMNYEGFTQEVRSQLRGLSDGNSAPLTVVSASRSQIEELFPDSPLETSPLHPLLTAVLLGRFSEGMGRSFLRQRLAEVGRRFGEEMEEQLLADSGGHPGRLQALAYVAYPRSLRIAGD